jgi:hypothetical protein
MNNHLLSQISEHEKTMTHGIENLGSSMSKAHFIFRTTTDRVNVELCKY